MSSKPLLLLLVAAALTSVAFSVLIPVNQVSVLPNRPGTTYVFGRDASSGAQIERIQLDLAGNNVDVNRVIISFNVIIGGRYLKEVGLYDSSGNLIVIRNHCGNEGAGSNTRTINVPNVPIDNVATVKACIVRVTDCNTSCL